MTAAARMARMRERRLAGRLLLQGIEVDEDTVPAALVALGFLAEDDIDDTEAITRAAEGVLNRLPMLKAVTRNNQ